MTNHHVPSYSDLLVGPAPEAAKLIEDIPSISLVFLITKFNFELYFEPNSQLAQNNILTHWLYNTSEHFKRLLNTSLYRYQIGLPTGAGYTLFGRRYLLAYLNLVLEHYNEKPQRRFAENDLVNSFMAYLSVIEKCHQEDQNSFRQSVETTELGKLQEITWPFLMPQFEFNYKPNDAIELFKLFAIINHVYMMINW